jgi:hypothetical protein
MIWFGKKRDGRQSLYSVSLPLYALPWLVILCAWLVVTTIRGCLS